jgi:hypothetical protein
MEYYTERTLARVSGISRDLLKAWNQSGYLKPTARARGRQVEWGYSRQQAMGVCALGRIRGEVPDRQLGRAAAMLPMALPNGGFLIFDGRMMVVAGNAEEAMNRMVLSVPRATWAWSIQELGGQLAH